MSLEDAPEDLLLEELLPNRFILFAYKFQATILETVSETEMRAKRPKSAGLRGRTRERERERAMVIFL